MWWLAGLLAATTLAPPPTPTAAPTPAPARGETVCTIDDPRATELSGLVATADGYVAINDGQDDPDRIRVFYLDRQCRVTRTLPYPTPARDPEDLATAPDGTLWVADTGDNANSEQRRKTVALWRIPAGGGAPVIYRLTYPDGPHDAEALLFAGDGTPIIVTKELAEPARLYVPTQPLQAGTASGVPLRLAGTFMPTTTATEPFGALAETMVTGAAVAPDRDRVILRTYLTAYEWDVRDGDVVAAITTGSPRVTALPDEPQGEAISYTMDGTRLVTVSDESGPTKLRAYQPSWTAQPAPAASQANPPDALPADGLPWLRAGAAGLGLVVAGAGLVLLGRRVHHSRRGRRKTRRS